MTVPFVNLAPTNEPVMDGVLTDLSGIARRGDFTLGDAVARFEDAWAAYCGARFCVAVGSGTDALALGMSVALESIGFIEPDAFKARVAVPAMTFQATWEAVTLAQATIWPVDVNEDDYCIGDVPQQVDAVVPVHLYGKIAMLDTEPPLIFEDACQAHGAHMPNGWTPGRDTGAAYSFYPTKNLGAWGDAGAFVTDDSMLADGVRALCHHGQRSKDKHEYVGTTARMDTVQAAVLLRKLPYLDEWNTQRRNAAAFYTRELAGVDGLTLPPDAEGHVWHLYVIRTEYRDGLQAFLADRGIGTGVHYPTPPHLTPAYAHLGYGVGDFPVAERLAREGLSLPLWPGITEGEQTQVVEAVRGWFQR